VEEAERFGDEELQQPLDQPRNRRLLIVRPVTDLRATRALALAVLLVAMATRVSWAQPQESSSVILADAAAGR
jgi:hypothetical protein